MFPDKSDFRLLPLIGTLSSGISYMGGIIIIPTLGRYPLWRNEMVLTGLVLCVAAFVGAAFSTRPIHLVITQGVLYSVGGGEIPESAIQRG